MKVLVTGSSGFVGQWLVKHLVDRGIEVRTLSRKSSPRTDKSRFVEEHLGDITHLESVISACRGVDSVFHLAGHVGYSRADREIMQRINVDGTFNVIQACQQNSIKRLVHMSSVVAVGASFDGKSPLDENSPYEIGNLDLGYFETKRAAELLVLDAVKRGLIDAVCVNPSTIYGAGDATKGSRKIQLKVARGQFPFYTSGGVSVVPIEDVVQGTLAAWEKGRSGERYILSGENLSIKEVFTTIAELAGAKAPHIYLPNPVVKSVGLIGDALEKVGRKGPLNSESAWTAILFHWFSHDKARRELGFNPGSAKEALSRSVDWIRQQGWLN